MINIKKWLILKRFSYEKIIDMGILRYLPGKKQKRQVELHYRQSLEECNSQEKHCLNQLINKYNAAKNALPK